jgi:oxygen-independent coproporphyrinogen-3 oxidase
VREYRTADFGRQSDCGLWTADCGLYVHIPFCRARCAYCDFNTYAGLECLIDDYVAALEREILFHVPYSTFHVPQRETWNLEPGTLYFGGGTPSLLSLEQIKRILDAIRRTFALAEDAEITLEANPGTVDLAYLQGLMALGINRLSLGVQSFDDATLRLMGRIHTAAEAVEAYRLARAAGFDNVNLDLIYGVPGQTLAQWQATLAQAVALAPEHLSLYALTLEHDVPLARRIASGELPPPDDDAAAAMYELAEEVLAAAGYVHYEISNWAREVPSSTFHVSRSNLEHETPRNGGHGTAWNLELACRHNLLYWHNQPYLGFGAGAHSSLPSPRRRGAGGEVRGGEVWRRWCNVLHPADIAEEVQELSTAEVMAETMILGLRLVQEGVRCADFRQRFGRDVREVYGAQLAQLRELGLLEADDQRVRLTPRGRLLGNEVFQRFLPSQ